MDLQVQTADGRPQQDLLQQTGKISVGTTGQNGRGTSGGTVIRVLNFEFWILNTNKLFWTRIIIFWTRILFFWTRITRITRIFLIENIAKQLRFVKFVLFVFKKNSFFRVLYFLRVQKNSCYSCSKKSFFRVQNNRSFRVLMTWLWCLSHRKV